MSQRERFCPACETAVKMWEFVAPADYYRCPVCLEATPFHDLPERDILRYFVDDYPPPYKFRAYAIDETSSATVTIGPISFTQGSTVIIHLAGNSTSNPSVVFGSQTASSGTFSVSGGRMVGQRYITNVSGASGSMVATFPATIPTLKIVAVTELFRTGSASFSDHFMVGSMVADTSIAPSASTAPNHPRTAFFGVIRVEGPASDPKGSWTAGYSDLFRAGTTSQATPSDNITMTVGVATPHSGNEVAGGTTVWNGQTARDGRLVGNGWYRP